MSVHEKLDGRDLRYLKFVFGRAQGSSDEEIVKELDDPDIDSPQVLYRQLKRDGHSICSACGTTYVEEGHCEPRGRRRKARRGAGVRTELPAAAEGIPLFDPVVDTLGSYVVDLTSLRETYADERFEAVDRYEMAALVDPVENTTTYGPATFPLGARQDPPHQLIALIAAYVIEGKPLDPLLEKLHHSATNVDQQHLEKKVQQLRLAARHVAKLVRGGVVRTGQNTDELDHREHAAAQYITSQLRAGTPEPEIDETLRDRGFGRQEIDRLKKLRIDYPDQ
jgi:hypothetical protein